MIPDMIHTPYIAPRISVMAPPPVTAERFVDELLSGLCMPDGGFVAHLAPSGDPFSNGWNAAMKLQANQPASRRLPMPVNVIFRNPATIVFWDDGDKTVVKCQRRSRSDCCHAEEVHGQRQYFQQGHQRVAGSCQLCQRPCSAGDHRVTNGRYHPTAFGSGADLYGRIGRR